MITIVTANKETHSQIIHDLFSEYLDWAASRVNQEYGLDFSADAILTHDMSGLDKFMPPKGRLLLAFRDSTPVGVACLKELSGDTGEVKRMYVQPGARGLGIGRALLQELIEAAQAIGYSCLRLDSARLMRAAHALYRSMGFTEIEAYEGSEIPPAFRSNWVFMEKRL